MMATLSQTTTATATTAVTSPAYLWEDALPTETDAFHDEKALVNEEGSPTSGRLPLATQNGNSTMRAVSNPEAPSQRFSDEKPGIDLSNGVLDGAVQHPQPEHNERKPRSLDDHANSENALGPHGATDGERADNMPGKGRDGHSDSDENSKWIHRDKLAKIESEELQAAGILLPRQRDRARSKSQNRPRRDQSQDKMNGSGRSIGGSEYTVSRSRKNSAATTSEMRTDLATLPSWDLRRPQEILEEGGDGHSLSNSSGKGSSRIPVAKGSPVPVPNEHIARDTRLARKRDGSPGVEETITYPRQRARSGSAGNALGLAKGTSLGSTPQPKRPDSSPKKPTTATSMRKPKPANGAAGRPKTRGGPSKDSTSSGTTRPSTRSGEREFSSTNSKPMEGEPPWMVSAYRPDPRLPPDQQLLPTVAKRLQQEKWEREGKFGSIYDKEFRPLTDEGFLRPPETSAQDKENEKEADKEEPKEGEGGNWPFKTEPKSPTLPARTNSYSTMPRITDTPARNSMADSRTPGHQAQPSLTVKAPEPREETPPQKESCGCCIVM